jgi:hypothetical protein
MSEHFLAFSGGVTATGGKLLAVNPSSISAIFSMWSKEYKEYVLTLLLINGRQIRIRESDVAHALEELGLSEYTEGWVLNLETDIG